MAKKEFDKEKFDREYPKEQRKEFDQNLEKVEEEILDCVDILKGMKNRLEKIKLYVSDNDDFV